MKSLSPWLCLTATTLTLAAFDAGLALACSEDAGVPPAYCTAPRFFTDEGGLIPPDAPSLPFRPGHATGFKLLTESGELVPSEIQSSDRGGAKLLVPLTPFAPNSSYRVTYDDHCTAPDEAPVASGKPASFTLTTSAQFPLPTHLGQIVVETEVKMVPLEDTCGTRTGETRTAIARVWLEPSAELGPLPADHLARRPHRRNVLQHRAPSRRVESVRDQARAR